VCISRSRPHDFGRLRIHVFRAYGYVRNFWPVTLGQVFRRSQEFRLTPDKILFIYLLCQRILSLGNLTRKMYTDNIHIDKHINMIDDKIKLLAKCPKQHVIVDCGFYNSRSFVLFGFFSSMSLSSISTSMCWDVNNIDDARSIRCKSGMRTRENVHLRFWVTIFLISRKSKYNILKFRTENTRSDII
jgi:hypothetical protein